MPTYKTRSLIYSCPSIVSSMSHFLPRCAARNSSGRLLRPAAGVRSGGLGLPVSQRQRLTTTALSGTAGHSHGLLFRRDPGLRADPLQRGFDVLWSSAPEDGLGAHWTRCRQGQDSRILDKARRERVPRWFVARRVFHSRTGVIAIQRQS